MKKLWNRLFGRRMVGAEFYLKSGAVVKADLSDLKITSSRRGGAMEWLTPARGRRQLLDLEMDQVDAVVVVRR